MAQIADDAPGLTREQRLDDVPAGSTAAITVAQEPDRPPGDPHQGKSADPPAPDGKSVGPKEAETVTRSLERLPQLYRQAIHWRNRDRHSFEQIGQMLGQSPEAARRLWVRALESLVQQLKESQ